MSQADSRIVYALSHDAELIKLAQSKPWEFDVHKFVGSCIFQVPEADIKGDIRQATKKIAHGTHYDEQEQRMSDSLLKDGYFFTPEECKAGQMRYLTRFPAIRDGYQFKSRMLVIAGNRRFLENSWGRRIYFPYERFDPQLYRRVYAWRAASEVADMLNQWGFIPSVEFLDKYNFKSRVNLQVHDEVLVSVTPENDECWDVMRVIRDSMEREREYEGVKLIMPVTFSLETRYHKEEVEWKKMPSYDEYKEVISKLWEQRIQ
jgi:DNA polymerase-1